MTTVDPSEGAYGGLSGTANISENPMPQKPNVSLRSKTGLNAKLTLICLTSIQWLDLLLKQQIYVC